MNNNIKKKSVLIVDDNANDIKILGSILKKNNFSINIAQTADSVFKILENEIVDCILLDITLPDMDGFEICKRLKKIEKIKDIPVLFVTGRADVISIINGFKVGGQDYIVKPFIAEELLARVTNAINLKRLNFQLQELVDEKTKQLVLEIQKQKEYENKLLEAKENLNIKNNTLQELIKHIETEKNNYRNEIINNLQTVVLPMLEKLETKINASDKYIIEDLKKIISGLFCNNNNIFKQMLTKLSPREFEVCSLIKDGKLNKEIADILNISEEAVKFHRKNIREKFNIKNKDINLQYFLNNMTL
ncbi:MAG TPA: response regulator [bacterium]|nr:response regulator [bacterium]